MNPNAEMLNSDATTPSSQDSNPYLCQTKIPDEMLGTYYMSNEYDGLAQNFQYMSFDQNPNMMAQMAPYYQYQMPYYDISLDQNTPYANEFPRAADYADRKSITEAFPELADFNSPDFDLDSIPSNAHFYVLRSSNDDNIHKAIKYHKWSSTPSGKAVLTRAWKEFEEAGLEPEIYFLFTVVNSNQFLGIAKMASNVNSNDTFKYWWEPCKWFGSFQLKWLYIKDIHYSYFEHIREEEHSTSIVNLRDGTKISADSGKEIINVFKHHPIQLNIFDSFEFMDRREDYIRSQRDTDPLFQQMFDEYCQAYINGEDVFYSQRKQSYYKPNSRKNSYNTTRKFSTGSNNGYYNPYYKKHDEKSLSGSQGSPPLDRYDNTSENGGQFSNESADKRRNYNGRYRGDRTGNGHFDARRNNGRFKTYYEKRREDGGNGNERGEFYGRRDNRKYSYQNNGEMQRQMGEDNSQHLMG